MADDARLARIEDKLDQMGAAIVALARVEERMVTLFNRLDVIDKERVEQANRLQAVEEKTGNNGQSLRFAERLFWIVVAASVTYLIKVGA
tara:strand:+ start:662 stop:931 length:270 start_codon:yes stop_codon:yes gene_type:complete